MHLSRRNFVRILAGTAGAATAGSIAFAPARAAASGGFRAMVGVFLFGGNDGWNMIVPADSRYPAYASARGSVALPLGALAPLGGSPFALHPSMAALRPVWDEGALGLVLNCGTLHAPITKAQYQSDSTLRPTNLMSHADEQEHWQGMRARDRAPNGFMGRMYDRIATTNVPSLISLAGSNLALIGAGNSPLILPSAGTLARSTAGVSSATRAAADAFAGGTGLGAVTDNVARELTNDYALATQTSSILSSASGVDSYFVDTDTGNALTSDVSRQLRRTAQLIEARATLGHSRQTFFVSQGGYDTHADQVDTDRTTGTHADLLHDLAQAMAAFHRAMKSLGMQENVTLFTMSDFGRTYRGNSQLGTDHAWGSNHLVLGGALRPATAHGLYPSPQLGGPDDMDNFGRFIPTTAQEEYIGAIARWHGVSDADMPYVFPNWTRWTTNGRGPLPLFG